jgi:hypothetical protein
MVADLIPCRCEARATILHGDAMPNDIEVMPISRFKATCLAVLERVRLWRRLCRHLLRPPTAGWAASVAPAASRETW